MDELESTFTTSFNIVSINTSEQPSPTPEDCWALDSTPPSCWKKWRDFHFYALAVILPIGLVFNSVCFGVFASSWMRKTIPGRYFMGLALADNLVLGGEFVNWLNTPDKLGVDFFHTIDGVCKFVHFLRYGAKMWSSWVTVSITIERFLTVTFPFQVRRISSPTKAVVVVVIEAAVCFSLASFAFFTLHSGKNNNNATTCVIIELHMNTYHYLIVILMAGFGELILPSIIVLLFTVLIIRKLLQARRRRQSLSSSERTNNRKQAHPTIALVIIAITFVTVRLPYMIMFLINQYSMAIWPHITWRGRYIVYALYTISKVLAVLNYATNFLFFCVAGNTFRVEMAKCCPWMSSAEPRGFQTQTSSVSLYRERASTNTVICLRAYGKTSICKLTTGTSTSLPEDSPSSSGSSGGKITKGTDSETEHRGNGQKGRRSSEKELISLGNHSGKKNNWPNKRQPGEIVYKWRDPLLNDDNTPNNNLGRDEI